MNFDLYICKECGRRLPNYHFFTKNGCKWCDIKHHKKPANKNNKGEKEVMKNGKDNL